MQWGVSLEKHLKIHITLWNMCTSYVIVSCFSIYSQICLQIFSHDFGQGQRCWIYVYRKLKISIFSIISQHWDGTGSGYPSCRRQVPQWCKVQFIHDIEIYSIYKQNKMPTAVAKPGTLLYNTLVVNINCIQRRFLVTSSIQGPGAETSQGGE